MTKRFVIRMIEPRPPGVNVYDLALQPRLGLPLIGRILADEGHDVRIYAEILSPVDWEDVLRSDLVGISTTTATTPSGYVMADRLRATGIPVVMGGSHVTFLPDEALAHCDFVVRGEGQETMLELLQALEGQRPLSSVLGLSYRDERGGIRHNPPRPPCSQEAFAALPAPDLSLVVGHERITTRPIMTQWGCPFNCEFCSVIQMFGRRVRSRNIEDVLDELAEQPDMSVFFYDDNFVVDKKRTKRLLRGMIERGLTAGWSAQMRAEAVYADRRTRTLDHELLGLMRDSNCTFVYCGFESVNQKTLEEYQKHQDLETIRDSIQAFHQYGIKVHGMFVLGSDADDVRTIWDTTQFALKNRIDTVQYLMLTPCPGTPFYERVRREGRLLSNDWTRYDGHHVVIRPARMTPYQLQVETYRAMMRFYSHWQIFRLLVSNVLHNFPSLAALPWREPRFSIQLPRLAFLAMLPGRMSKVVRIASQHLSRQGQTLLLRVFTVAALRKYGHDQLVKWTRQARSVDYLRWIKRLSQSVRTAS